MHPPHEAAEMALRMVRESADIVYDTETSGLDWKHNWPVGYVVGAPEDGRMGPGNVVYVPVRHGGGGNLLGGRPLSSPTEGFELHDFERELAAAFASRPSTHGRVIGHHTKFDAHMSANAGIMLGRRMACTQNMAALLDEYARSYGLEDMATKYGVEAKKGTTMYEHLAREFGGKAVGEAMGNFWRLAGIDPVAYEYATGDGVSTYQLYQKEMEQIEKEEMSFVCELENDLIWTTFRMERKGIKVDISALDALRIATEKKIAKLSEVLPIGFNTRSPLQMKALMEAHGHTDWPKTDLGNPSFTEKWLKRNPIGRVIVEIRQAVNLINSFVGPLETKHMHKGRVHATLHQMRNDERGTISGRYSCSEPNLQQVPKRNKDIAVPFRRLFVADEGKIFWERDYSQCEPRLFAHYSQDPNLLAGYNATPPMDAHQVTADLLAVERDPTAKRMNMGIFTGMQVDTFADHMGWSKEQAQEKFDAWFRAYPSIRKFQNNAKAKMKNRGYVFTLLGRRGRMDHPRFAYRGTSKIIQGSNADILKLKMLQIDRLCEDAGDIVQVLMTVHDSFNGQRDDTPEAKSLFFEIERVMVDVMGPPLNLTVPFTIDGHEGANWAIATYGEETLEAYDAKHSA